MRSEISVHSSDGRPLRNVRPEFAGKLNCDVRTTCSDFVSNVNTSGRE